MIAATATPLTTGRVHGRVGRASPIAAHAAPNKGSAAGAVDTLSSFANPQKDNGRAGNWSSPKSLLPIHGEVARSAGGAPTSRALTPFLPIHGEVARSAGGAAENPYLPLLVCGLWGTVRFRGGRRPACSGFTFSPSPSLRLARPAVAWRVRSLARRSFLAARAVFRASESWVSFMGTTRRRASSSRTSTSALVSSRSMVLDTVSFSIPFQATERIHYPASVQVIPRPSVHCINVIVAISD